MPARSIGAFYMKHYLKWLTPLLLIVVLAGCNFEVGSNAGEDNQDDTPESPALIWDEGSWDDREWQ